LLLRKPKANGFETGDQGGCHAQSNQRATNGEACQSVCGTEQGCANRGNEQQYALHPPRPIAVQRDADRQLRGRERKEVDCGKQSEVGRAQLHARRKLGRDDGIDRSIEVGEKVATREWEKHKNDWASISNHALSAFLIGLRCGYPVHAKPESHDWGTSSGVTIVLIAMLNQATAAAFSEVLIVG